MLGSEPDLQTRVKNLRGSSALPPPKKIEELNSLFCDDFQLDKTMPNVEK